MDRLHSLDSQRRQERGVHNTNTHTHRRHLVNNDSPTRVAWLSAIIPLSQEEFKSPGRRANSTDRDSWPPSTSETLSSSGFVILHYISTLAVKSRLHRPLIHAGVSGWSSPRHQFWNALLLLYYCLQRWVTHTAAQAWTRPSPLKCCTSQIARWLHSW